MPVAFDFRQELFGPWPVAQGYLVEQLDRLYASLGPISPLLDGLAATTQQLSTLAGNAVVSTGSYTAQGILTTNSAGSPSFTTTLPQALQFTTGVTITPTVLTVNTNDYGPSGLATAAVVRIASTGAIDLTGLAAATNQSVFHLLSNVGAFTITLKNASASSAAANRWRCPGAVDFGLATGTAVWIWYDVTLGVWQVIL